MMSNKKVMERSIVDKVVVGMIVGEEEGNSDNILAYELVKNVHINFECFSQTIICICSLKIDYMIHSFSKYGKCVIEDLMVYVKVEQGRKVKIRNG